MHQTKERMTKAIQAYTRELATIRAGRASASLLDRITVDYYGAPTPVNQMAGISTPEARFLSFNLMINQFLVILKKQF